MAAREVDELAGALDELELQRGHHVEATLAAAVAAEQRAVELGADVLVRRAQLVQGDMLHRQGSIAASAELVWRVQQWATEHGSRPLLARAHRLLATVHHSLGDAATALEHAVRGVELLDDDVRPEIRVQHLTTLGDALGWNDSYAAARERYITAERLAISIRDIDAQLYSLNNLAYTEWEAGELDRAEEIVERMVRVAQLRGVPLNPMFLDTIARVQLCVGHAAAAVETMRLAIRGLEDERYEVADALAELYLTLGEAQLGAGDVEGASRTLRRAEAEAGARGLVEVLVRIREQQAEVAAATGDYRTAFELHKLFHAESERLSSEQAEARARSRQEMLETKEAKEAADRFRRQALSDPLTGLPNRRYADEQLPVLLERAAAGDEPLSLALVDLDHFKRVNDTLSHAVGDTVLCLVATVLADELARSLPPREDGGPFVARIGGEEFLVVLPETPLATAVGLLDRLRGAVAGYDWAPHLGDLSPLTASAGVTSSSVAIGKSELLAMADEALYAAKHAGRNRTVALAGAGAEPPRDGLRRRAS